MKQRLSVFGIAIALFSGTVLSQTATNFGVEAGLNFGNSTTSPTSLSTTARTGLMIGGFADIGFSEMISLWGEVYYIQKGAEFSIVTSSGSATATAKFNYLELAPLLKLKFGTSEFKPFVFAGPSLGINLNAEGESKSGTQSSTTDLKSITESTDFALAFGAGDEFKVGPTTGLMISIRYSLGLSDIDKDATSSWKSNGLQLLLGAKFGM